MPKVKRSIMRIVLIVMTAAATMSFALAAENVDGPPGGIRLLEGYEHQVHWSKDYRTGRIWKPGGPEIVYEVDRKRESTRELDPTRQAWLKRGEIHGRQVELALMDDDTLVVSFAPSESDRLTANFRATMKSSEQLAEVLLVVLGYPVPAKPQPATQP